MIPLAVINDLFLIIVVIASFFYLRKQLFEGNFAHNIIKQMFYLIVTLIGVDVVLHFTSGHVDLFSLNNVLSVIGVVLISSIGYLWLLYIRAITYFKVKLVRIIIIIASLFTLNLILSIISITPGQNIYFNITGTSVAPGRLFFIYAIVSLLPYLFSTIILILQWKSLKKKRRPFIFLGISFFPVLGILSQIVDFDFTLNLASVVITFVIIIFDIQHQFVVTDYLTGLYNRRRLSQKLSERVAKMKEGEMFGGFMIDINNFKLINDEYGHAYGDRIIQDVASILLRISNPDDLVSRFGGDEFVIITDIKSRDELRAYKHKIIDAVAEHNKKTDSEIQIQLGIGAEIYTKKSDYTPDRFLEIIDELMYRNKKMIKHQSEDEKSTTE